ncbi:MAG: hypothetical protein H6R01_63 [Burkholderiaceae bacterium]|nr:hypothetical protein [Burkholderiaceae bacterium]
MIKIASGLVLVCACTTCFAQTALDKLSRVLDTVQALGGAQAATTGSINFKQAVPTPEEQTAFRQRLVPPQKIQSRLPDWQAAMQMAEKFVTLAACGIGPYPQNGAQNEIEGWKTMRRWIDPDDQNPHAYGSLVLAMWHAQYHPKSTCMAINRIDRWSQPAANAISMRIQYYSPASNETAMANYAFKRMADGAWVFKAPK